MDSAFWASDDAPSDRLARFRSDPRFVNIRQQGTIAALDLAADTTGYLSEVGPRLRAFFRQRDLLIRPLGNVIYLMPPYCLDADQLDHVFAVLQKAGEMFGRSA